MTSGCRYIIAGFVFIDPTPIDAAPISRIHQPVVDQLIGYTRISTEVVSNSFPLNVEEEEVVDNCKINKKQKLNTLNSNISSNSNQIFQFQFDSYE